MIRVWSTLVFSASPFSCRGACGAGVCGIAVVASPEPSGGTGGMPALRVSVPAAPPYPLGAAPGAAGRRGRLAAARVSAPRRSPVPTRRGAGGARTGIALPPGALGLLRPVAARGAVTLLPVSAGLLAVLAVAGRAVTLLLRS